MTLWLYRAARFVFMLVFAVLYRWDVRGREHLPAQGPVLVCANHIHGWDPPLVGTVMTRPVFFMAKEELFRYPVLGTLLAKVGAFPVRRGTPDRRALKTALDLLASGKVVGLFPEGTRSRDGRLR
ncbi:MAG TPA: lysophospholipid acyltransferase family protein, partial [Bacillota bacterium]